MNNEKLIQNIKESNLLEEDKKELIKLLNQNRFDEYIKIILRLLKLGSLFFY